MRFRREAIFIKPSWNVPTNIQAFSTLRTGGVSPAPYESLNLGINVNDCPINIQKNREILQKSLKLPAEPVWLKQTHSNIVIPCTENNRYQEADASFTDQKNTVCVVLTADCLPILLCNKQGTYVAAIHAGWRGLLNGIIDATLDTLNLNADDILVWLGPAIGPAHFEVGNEVRDLFINQNEKFVTAFDLSHNNRSMCNIYTIARLQLEARHIHQIYGGNDCTYSDPHNFYSYRRDGVQTGRMASLIWINSSS